MKLRINNLGWWFSRFISAWGIRYSMCLNYLCLRPKKAWPMSVAQKRHGEWRHGKRDRTGVSPSMDLFLTSHNKSIKAFFSLILVCLVDCHFNFLRHVLAMYMYQDIYTCIDHLPLMHPILLSGPWRSRTRQGACFFPLALTLDLDGIGTHDLFRYSCKVYCHDWREVPFSLF